MDLISTQELCKSYDHVALSPISIILEKGQHLGIVGETGSGKSTFLKILGGMVQPTSGKAFYMQDEIIGPSEKLVAGHSSITYFSQHFELPKFITVSEYLDDPFLIDPEDAEKIYRACRVDHLLGRDTRELSGGEKQRVALCKLLLKSPEVLLLDEPFSNLDFHHKSIIRQVISSIEKELDTTIIMVTHDPKDILPWANRVLVFRNGRIIQDDTPEKIYNQPFDAYVAGLFGPYNLLQINNWIKDSPSLKGVNNTHFIVRPEEIKISKDGKQGTIVEINYYGSYDEIITRIEDEFISFYSKVGEWTVGDIISLKLIEN